MDNEALGMKVICKDCRYYYMPRWMGYERCLHHSGISLDFKKEHLISGRKLTRDDYASPYNMRASWECGAEGKLFEPAPPKLNWLQRRIVEAHDLQRADLIHR